ncbi:MAG: hypothetical protein MJZ13_06510 [Bacteroidales bacterium]|nr:hypothetical protein [Bacteroidales bacterium]
MARIVLKDGVTLKGARRMMTKHGGSFRITKRNGKLFTFKKFKCKQPNTAAQVECREMLRKANERAREDMVREGRREYWAKKAEEMGYKTAMGCARAWYIAEMKGNMLKKKEEKDTVEEKEREDKYAREDKKTGLNGNGDKGGKREVIMIGRRWKMASRKKRQKHKSFEHISLQE